MSDAPEPESMGRCDNCGGVYAESTLRQPADLEQRLDPGGEVPLGECPGCGALAYLLKPDAPTPASLPLLGARAQEPIVQPRTANHRPGLLALRAEITFYCHDQVRRLAELVDPKNLIIALPDRAERWQKLLGAAHDIRANIIYANEVLDVLDRLLAPSEEKEPEEK